MWSNAMRTIVDLPEDELRALKAAAKRDGVSQAEAIRRAIRAYLASRPAPDRASPAFGLWANRQDRQEGVAYQRALRDEWAE